MRKPEIVLSLGEMIREFVAERETDSDRSAGSINDVNSNDLRLFAGVERKGGAC
jgi:hypothetical protein